VSQTIFTQLLILLAGAVLGIAGTAFKGYYDRREEARRTETAVWLNLLTPLRVAAAELSGQLRQAFANARKDQDVPGYHLQDWFKRCKDYVIVPSEEWPDDQRLEDFAMHSGGEGTEAISTLYITALYLFYATQVRYSPPGIASKSWADRLRVRVDAVRHAYEAIEFYPMTQDSTGLSMRRDDGTAKNYRHFGESITAKAERGWFLTLTDVYLKLGQHEPSQVERILKSLDELAAFLAA
jgi:hypothetical protein